MTLACRKTLEKMMAREVGEPKAWNAPKLHRLQVRDAESGGVTNGDGGGPTSKKS